MITIRNDGYWVVCDGPTCMARTDLGQARASGWMLTALVGPHLCPADIAARFHQLIDHAFHEP